MNFLRKTICFTNFPTFMNLFGHWAKNVQSFVLLSSSAGPSKKQPMCPEVVCDEKQNFSNVSKKGVFLIIVYGLWSEKFALSEKNNCLGFNNSVLCIQRNVLGENFCIKKLFFLRFHGFWEKKFRIFVKLFPARLSSFHSTFAGGGFRENILQKVFFHCFQTWSKKSTIERTSRWMWKLYSTSPVEFFLGKTFFLKLFDVFFYVFRAKDCKFWKNSRRILKIAFYTSKGTSWWNYFGSLKTFFLEVFGLWVKTISLIFSACS